MGSAATFPYEPDYVVHPGAMLQEWLEAQVPRPELSIDIDGIIAGDTIIDEDLANQLARMTQISAVMWLNMEHNFRAGLAAGLTWIP